MAGRWSGARVWLLATGLWLAIGVAVSWSNIAAVLATTGLYGVPMVSVPCVHRDNTPVRGVEGRDYSRDGATCRFRLTAFRALYPEYDQLDDNTLIEDVLRNGGRSALWPTLLRILATLGLPPLALAGGLLLRRAVARGR
jgi:hypothetical protein